MTTREPSCPDTSRRVERTACLVATDDGERLASFSELPAVGDWAALELHDDAVVVRGVVPRWSELARRDPDTDTRQVLAANVDLVLVTVPGDRPSVTRVERETVLAWESGARPVVVLTKADLAAPGLAEELEGRLVGVDVLVTSSVTGDGVTAVGDLLAPNRTAVLLGPSGAGKSTLVNALLGWDRLDTGAVPRVRRPWPPHDDGPRAGAPPPGWGARRHAGSPQSRPARQRRDRRRVLRHRRPGGVVPLQRLRARPRAGVQSDRGGR